MNFGAFIAISQKNDISATIANSRVDLSTLGVTVPFPANAEINLRVSNEATAAVIVAQGDSTVDATSDTRALSVPPNQVVFFNLRPGTTHVAVALRSGTGTVQICVGSGIS